ncbi:hypothetical protein Syun_019720 [Stephania yunnanensis]|uniref:Uncharacterized protein n=1 Tax=Stephania yunnanensis TaxID=152371 RepID=A0AAP0IWB6_9MAGN
MLTSVSTTASGNLPDNVHEKNLKRTVNIKSLVKLNIVWNNHVYISSMLPRRSCLAKAE